MLFRSIGAARREAARALADLWLGWLAATRTQELLKEQVSFAEANYAAVEKRKRAGDASALDLNIAQADLTDVRRQASQVDSNVAKARAKLRVRFPNAPLEPVALADPEGPMWTEAQWRERIVAQAAPLRIAAGQVRKAELSASRANADKVPDPTLGVFTSLVVKKDGRREAWNREKLMGGLMKAVEKRPVPLPRLDAIVDQIESRLQECADREIETRVIGERVMESLKDLDKVAYVRFASVYRRFEDVNEFLAELKGLIDTRK